MVQDIFNKKQRKKARRDVLRGDREHLPMGAQAKKGGGSVSPTKKAAGPGAPNKGSYAARFLLHRQPNAQMLPAYQQDHAAQQMLPAYLQEAAALRRVTDERHAQGKGGETGALSPANLSLSRPHRSSMGAPEVPGVVEEHFVWTSIGEEGQAPRRGPPPAARSPDRWGGGGSGKAYADRSAYVRGSGAQIAPSYMRGNECIDQLDASVRSCLCSLLPSPCAPLQARSTPRVSVGQTHVCLLACPSSNPAVRHTSRVGE